MKCNPVRWLWGLIPIAMLSWATYYRERDAIEADIYSRASKAVAAAGQKWANVDLSGRDVVITGRARKDGEPKAALDAVRFLWGVRKVELKTDIAAASAELPELRPAIGPLASEEGAKKAKQIAEAAAAEKAKKAAEAAAAAEKARKAAALAAAAEQARKEAEIAAAAQAKLAAEAAATLEAAKPVVDAEAVAADKAKKDAEAAAAADKAKKDAEAAAAADKAKKDAEAAAAADKAKKDAEAATVAADKAKKDAEAAAAADKAKKDAEAAAAAAAKAKKDAEAATAADKAKKDAEAVATDKAKKDAEAAAAADKAKKEADVAAEAAAKIAHLPRSTTKETRACEQRLAEAAKNGTILFERAKADIQEASVITIARLAEIVKSCPRTRIEVEGHTDSEGEPERNQGLSERRAHSVVKSLVFAGVPASRLTAVGYGAGHPVAGNDTPENMARNRRIEFKVFSN
ncbi:MAG: OmpA family protein [Hyphomicrobium sp.]|jgi:outer membrane protein OmpA-like peptidoglycan-associated protein